MLLADGAVSSSHTWIWAVIGGLVLAGALLWHILNATLTALPEEVRAPVKASMRANSRPLAVMAVAVVWTLTYALYSVAHLPSPPTQQNTAAQTQSGSVTTTTTTVPVPTPTAGSAAKPGLPASSGPGGTRGPPRPQHPVVPQPAQAAARPMRESSDRRWAARRRVPSTTPRSSAAPPTCAA